MTTLVKNVNIVTYDTIIYGGTLTFRNGVIEYIGKEEKPADFVVDGNNGFLIPGFVDIHCHGGSGCDFLDGDEASIKTVLSHHLSHGTTTMLATTTTTDFEVIKQSLRLMAEHKRKRPQTPLYGAHLEGPWLNPLQCGAQDVNYMRLPSAKEIVELKGEYPFIVRVSAAPELDENLAFGEKCVELGVKVGFAHTDADFAQIEKAKEKGYTIATHLYSGMKGVYRKNSFRTGGAVEAGLFFDDIYAEVIADGRHLPYELLRYIYKQKGAEKICLITDGMRGSGLANGSVCHNVGPKHLTGQVVIEDEVAKLLDRQSFAGSVATMDRIYRTMAEAIGKDFVTLSKMASTTPARVMGLEGIGEIKEGYVADLLLINEDMDIVKIFTDKNIAD